MSSKSSIRRCLQARAGWLLVIVPTALAVLANPSPLERLDLLLYDAIEPLVAPAPAAEPQAVIVAIDERSIAALQRLRAEQEVPVNMPSSLTAFGINGGLKNGLAGLLMTHPPLEDRIEALRRRG